MVLNKVSNSQRNVALAAVNNNANMMYSVKFLMVILLPLCDVETDR